MSDKISIRFFDNREVRAIWDDAQNKWWYSIVDIIAILTESTNPRKYWSVMKTRLKKEGNQLTTKCSQLKLISADGKKYATDCFSQDDIIEVVKLIPGKNSIQFLDWFTYSDNSIDGQSKLKAYALFESSLITTIEVGTLK
jgi:cell filamentation protein